MIAGCAVQTTHTEQADKVSSDKGLVLALAGITQFSYYPAYMSEEAINKCAAEHVTCIDDPIDQVTWHNALKQAMHPASLEDTDTTSDYEILIASHKRQMPSELADSGIFYRWFSDTSDLMSSVHSEITVQWRGFALDTYAISSAVTKQTDYQKLADSLVSRWLAHAANVGIFTREFLYSALKASNYRDNLHLPKQLGEFYLEDMQLYPDPFLGAIARYRHPIFSEALFDVSVSPIMKQLQHVDFGTFEQALNEEFFRAQNIATERQYTLVVDAPVSQIAASNGTGAYFAVHAVDEFGEPLYAATYVFRQEDKLVKFTSTFPHQVAMPIVEQALAEMRVPGESELMKELRSLF
ncbi:hypothetical protein DRW07_12595 [Alteromonas sediminis]|uniref:Uncharacterized protein n=1 Tax=Alteromonas sediminis TaxID=2259342 RepID=A0A3N5XYW8_9ALTE|nr:hypothetical protein [Alteromonas sediminis]RPJ65653.1 hypothetical protein DRW07_12595 [Alteromonas sediminis]